MANGVEFKLIRVDELLDKLELITNDTERKDGRAALRKVANIITSRTKANANRLDDPAAGRNIADNIVARWNGRGFKCNGNLAFRIEVSHGAVLEKHLDRARNAPTPHRCLLEFGTEKMRAEPFMRPTAESSAEDATRTFVEKYGKAIDRTITKAVKKGRGG